MKKKAINLTTQISFLIFPLLLSSFQLVHAKKQSEALSQLIKKNRTSLDRRHFNASDEKQYHFHAQDQPADGQKENDRIEKLPGQPRVRFRQYGGYVTVNRRAGRALYYYFVEAHNSHNSLPLLLWLNGGPGCSSFGYGAMQELGPFRVHSDGKTLYKNKFAWNYAANVLFLESPAGVGFSYSNTTVDTSFGGDTNTAIDNYIFLLNWFERFPEYKNRDFYISGESYAGHYVPQLAHSILHHNMKANKTIINLKGIIVGNAWINKESDMKGMYEFLESHGLISDETLNKILKYCDFLAELSKQCNEATDEAGDITQDINIYNIYAPQCSDHSRLTDNPKKTSAMYFDPCSEHYVEAYLNRPDVQEALHANVTKLPYPWQSCSELIDWVDSPTTVIPLIFDIMANGLRVWLYSGDTDAMIPVTSTKNSIKQMNLRLNTHSHWHPWYFGGQVGGFAAVYEEGNLTFATILGAGHQVPSYSPATALSLITHFLNGNNLPTI